jgi:hypothetical protein
MTMALRGQPEGHSPQCPTACPDQRTTTLAGQVPGPRSFWVPVALAVYPILRGCTVVPQLRQASPDLVRYTPDGPGQVIPVA